MRSDLIRPRTSAMLAAHVGGGTANAISAALPEAPTYTAPCNILSSSPAAPLSPFINPITIYYALSLSTICESVTEPPPTT